MRNNWNQLSGSIVNESPGKIPGLIVSFGQLYAKIGMLISNTAMFGLIPSRKCVSTSVCDKVMCHAFNPDVF